MLDSRFPNWDFNLKEGTIFSLKTNKYLGSINKKNNHIFVGTNGGYKQSALYQYIWMVANGCDIPEGYDIHHKDNNPLNNSIDNLELVNHSEHRSKHMEHYQCDEQTKKKISESMQGNTVWNEGVPMKEDIKLKISKTLTNNPITSKKVGQYSLNGELIKVWDSLSECGRNGYNHKTISMCCLGKKYKQHKGYIWKYYIDDVS